MLYLAVTASRACDHATASPPHPEVEQLCLGKSAKVVRLTSHLQKVRTTSRTYGMNFFHAIGQGEAKLWDFDRSVIWRYLIFWTHSEFFDAGKKWIFVERRPRAFEPGVTCVTVTISTQFHVAHHAPREGCSESLLFAASRRPW